MPTELESKIRVDDHGPAREKLRAAGARYVGRVLETNRILDRDDGQLLMAGVGLRIRGIEVLDGDGPRDTLTYKGAKIPGKFKQREELETEVEDAGALADIFAALGFTDRMVFEKRRESWKLGGCSVELDEVPRLGLFVEVEGPDEGAIDNVLAAIGLIGESSIQESYVALLMAGTELKSGETREFRFA